MTHVTTKERILLGAHLGNEKMRSNAIERYNKIKKKCKNCNKEIPYEKRQSIFCNHQCSAEFNNKKRGIKKKKCQNDNCQQYVTMHRVYCSRNCRIENDRKIYLEKWDDGKISGITGVCGISKTIRKYILEKFDYKCAKCGWCEINLTTGKIPLQIDHINGNCLDNSEKNLILLCPNCHSLTPTFGSINKQKGRPTINKEYKDKKSVDV